MRVENPKLVVEPGAGRTGKLAMVAYQFQQAGFFYSAHSIVDVSRGYGKLEVLQRVGRRGLEGSLRASSEGHRENFNEGPFIFTRHFLKSKGDPTESHRTFEYFY
jgi:hypothetical protein